jgi:hypothetical protein
LRESGPKGGGPPVKVKRWLKADTDPELGEEEL